MKKIVLLIAVICSFCIGYLSAQNNKVSSYPELKHSTFLANTHALNRLNDDQKGSVNVLHQRYLNLFSDVYFVDFSGFVKIRKRHQLGLLANSLKEGPYISKTNAALHYAYNLRISTKSTLSAGIKAGISGLYYNGVESGVIYKSTVPDLSIDMLFRHKFYYVFYGYNQLIGADLVPLKDSIVQKPFHEVRIGGTLTLSRTIELLPQGHFIFYKDRPNVYGGSLSLSVNSLISIGIASYNLNSAIGQFSVSIPDVNNWKLSLIGSYRQIVGAKQHNLYNNSWEIGLVLAKKVKDVVYEAED